MILAEPPGTTADDDGGGWGRGRGRGSLCDVSFPLQTWALCHIPLDKQRLGLMNCSPSILSRDISMFVTIFSNPTTGLPSSVPFDIKMISYDQPRVGSFYLAFLPAKTCFQSPWWLREEWTLALTDGRTMAVWTVKWGLNVTICMSLSPSSSVSSPNSRFLSLLLCTACYMGKSSM